MSQFVEKFSGRDEQKAQLKLETQNILLQTKDRRILIEAEIADVFLERQVGLMFRKALKKREEDNAETGMLFVFPNETVLKFWMKNTRIPLDMIFADRDMKIIGIVENAEPCKKDPCPTYGPEESAQYVLEVNKGFVNEYNVEIGDMMELSEGS